MPLRVNAYRGFIVKMFFPFIVLLLVPIIGLVICIVTDFENTDTISFFWLILCSVILMLLIIVVLYAVYAKPKRWFLFDSETIQVCDKNGAIDKINVNEVENIKYYSFKFRYIITIFFGELNECGAWKLYFKFKNGKSKVIGMFDRKSVQAIKNLYGDMLVIK